MRKVLSTVAPDQKMTKLVRALVFAWAWRLAPPVLAPARVSWGVDGVILPDGSDLDSGHLTHSGVV